MFNTISSVAVLVFATSALAASSSPSGNVYLYATPSSSSEILYELPSDKAYGASPGTIVNALPGCKVSTAPATAGSYAFICPRIAAYDFGPTLTLACSPESCSVTQVYSPIYFTVSGKGKLELQGFSSVNNTDIINAVTRDIQQFDASCKVDDKTLTVQCDASTTFGGQSAVFEWCISQPGSSLSCTGQFNDLKSTITTRPITVQKMTPTTFEISTQSIKYDPAMLASSFGPTCTGKTVGPFYDEKRIIECPSGSSLVSGSGTIQCSIPQKGVPSCMTV